MSKTRNIFTEVAMEIILPELSRISIIIVKQAFPESEEHLTATFKHQSDREWGKANKLSCFGNERPGQRSK